MLHKPITRENPHFSLPVHKKPILSSPLSFFFWLPLSVLITPLSLYRSSSSFPFPHVLQIRVGDLDPAVGEFDLTAAFTGSGVGSGSARVCGDLRLWLENFTPSPFSLLHQIHLLFLFSLQLRRQQQWSSRPLLSSPRRLRAHQNPKSALLDRQRGSGPLPFSCGDDRRRGLGMGKKR